MRTAELLLISLPIVLACAWLLGVRHASFRAIMATALGLAAVGIALFWFGEQRSFTGHYTPARWQNGRLVPEHGGTIVPEHGGTFVPEHGGAPLPDPAK